MSSDDAKADGPAGRLVTDVRMEGTTLTLGLPARLTLEHATNLREQLSEVLEAHPNAETAAVDLTAVEQISSAALGVLVVSVRSSGASAGGWRWRCRGRGAASDPHDGAGHHLHAGRRPALGVVGAEQRLGRGRGGGVSASGSTDSAPRALLTRLGAATLGKLSLIGSVGLLMLQAVLLLPRQLYARRGRSLAYRNLGVPDVPRGGEEHRRGGAGDLLHRSDPGAADRADLRQYGALDQLASLIGVAMFRELGPLIGAIVLTGFAGASIAAEIGTMAVGEN